MCIDPAQVRQGEAGGSLTVVEDVGSNNILRHRPTFEVLSNRLIEGKKKWLITTTVFLRRGGKRTSLIGDNLYNIWIIIW